MVCRVLGSAFDIFLKICFIEFSTFVLLRKSKLTVAFEFFSFAAKRKALFISEEQTSRADGEGS